MHSPLATQALAHFCETSGPLPSLRMSSTPDTTAFGSASAMPAPPVIGQAVKQAPHLVQASSMSSTRAVRASSNPAFCIDAEYLKSAPAARSLGAILRDAQLRRAPQDEGGVCCDLILRSGPAQPPPHAPAYGGRVSKDEVAGMATSESPPQPCGP